jgi:hypothetical protein
VSPVTVIMLLFRINVPETVTAYCWVVVCANRIPPFLSSREAPALTVRLPVAVYIVPSQSSVPVTVQSLPTGHVDWLQSALALALGCTLTTAVKTDRAMVQTTSTLKTLP